MIAETNTVTVIERVVTTAAKHGNECLPMTGLQTTAFSIIVGCIALGSAGALWVSILDATNEKGREKIFPILAGLCFAIAIFLMAFAAIYVPGEVCQ